MTFAKGVKELNAIYPQNGRSRLISTQLQGTIVICTQNRGRCRSVRIAGDDCDLCPKPEIDVDRCPITGEDRGSKGRNRWEKAMIAFTLLNDKIYTTPILKHFETDLPPVIVMYASKWAVSAALLQEYDVVY